MLIQKKIMFAGLALLVASMLSLYVVMQQLALPRLYQTATDKAQLQVKNTASEVTNTLSSAAALTQSIAALAQSLPLDETLFIQQIKGIVNQFGNSAVAGGGIWPEPNAFIPEQQRASLFWARNTTGGLDLLDDFNKLTGSGYHNENWYKVGRSLSAGQCGWSEAYVDTASGVTMTTCTVAINRDGKFWGVATIDLMLSGLSRLLQNQNDASGGFAFVIDQSNRIIAMPGLRNKDYSTQPLDSMVANDASLKPLRDALQKNTSNIELPVGIVADDESILVVQEMKNQGWKIGMVLPHKVALATLNSITQTLYTALFPLILIFIIALVVFGRRLLSWIDETTAQVNNLTSGQISNRLKIEREDEIGKLRMAVNEYGDHLGTILKNIADEAIDVKNGAEALSDFSHTLTQRAQTHMDENYTLASAINEMSASAAEVSQNTITAAETAESASALVIEGQQAVKENSQAISQLADALTNASRVIDRLATDTQQVGAVLDVIKAISEQTNLLALNAAIEAARAGEQGRGFAVVADEVRTLAGRTQDSAREIENMITQLQNAAVEGVAVIDKSRSLSQQSIASAELSRNSFGSIVEAFSNIRDRTMSIATAAEEQAKVTGEIHELAERIREISEQNAKDATQLNDMSQSSTNLAQRLHQISKH